MKYFFYYDDLKKKKNTTPRTGVWWGMVPSMPDRHNEELDSHTEVNFKGRFKLQVLGEKVGTHRYHFSGRCRQIIGWDTDG